MSTPPLRTQVGFTVGLLVLGALVASQQVSGDEPVRLERPKIRVNAPLSDNPTSTATPSRRTVQEPVRPAPLPATTPQPAPIPAPSQAAARPSATGATPLGTLAPEDTVRSVQSVAFFALMSFAPAAILMLTGFVRIQIVLTLLRQALGSPQVPGNQVLTGLAMLLTFLVMAPVGQRIYERSIEPYRSGTITAEDAWREGSGPLKQFMVKQILRTHHQDYLWKLYDHVVPPSPGRVDPSYGDEFPFHVVASAFLLSELTTALVIGFVIYLPFLVVDLVVSAVLAAMGLFMLPPTLVALPLKLILFVLADGWLLVATMLLETFSV